MHNIIIEKNRNLKSLVLSGIVFAFLLSVTPSVLGQGQGGLVKWIRVGSFQSLYSEQGSEVEGGGTDDKNIGVCWPAEYGTEQAGARAKALWMGCRNFYDIIANRTFPIKVVGVGPRSSDNDRTNQIREGTLVYLGRFAHPSVVVDGEQATSLSIYDQLEADPDESMLCDRMIVNQCHSVLGITMTRKIMAFTQSEHSNYMVYDYVFKNTGIILDESRANPQTLQDCYFYFNYRYAFSGESVSSFGVGWGTWDSVWGQNTVNHVIGTDPNAADFKFRAHYAWYGPNSARNVPLEDDWGCPNEQVDGVMAAARYGGAVVLHADTDANNKEDDKTQPRTTGYLNGDDATCYPISQYDDVGMTTRWNVMTAGHQERTHTEELEFQGISALDMSGAAGFAQGHAFGPYTLAPGDSIHIVLAEGIAGIDRVKNREVGLNWCKWYTNTGIPTLIMPDGSETTDYTAYKRAWVQTSEDSLMKTFEHAIANYESGYQIPQAPPPPSWFNVQSGGDRISLSWNSNATESEHFDGYVIYRCEGVVLDPETRYQKIFECSGGADLKHAYNDTSAVRGLDYYYYIQSKSDGSDNDLDPGEPLYSSMFWTVTNKAANLLRPAKKTTLDSIRVVPNPFDIRSRRLQFTTEAEAHLDRIVFFGLPAECTIKIYTERGDLVWEKEHTNGAGDEYWDSKTNWGQIIVSGLYIAYFEVPRDIYDTGTGKLLFRKGENIYRKFIVIR
jgi:hypothetical protein